MTGRGLHRIDIGDDQGRRSDASLRASRACLGLNPDTREIFETPLSRALALVMLIAWVIVLTGDKLGIPL